MNLEEVKISDSHAPTLLNAMNLEVVEISDSSCTYVGACESLISITSKLSIAYNKNC